MPKKLQLETKTARISTDAVDRYFASQDLQQVFEEEWQVRCLGWVLVSFGHPLIWCLGNAQAPACQLSNEARPDRLIQSDARF